MYTNALFIYSLVQIDESITGWYCAIPCHCQVNHSKTCHLKFCSNCMPIHIWHERKNCAKFDESVNHFLSYALSHKWKFEPENLFSKMLYFCFSSYKVPKVIDFTWNHPIFVLRCVCHCREEDPEDSVPHGHITSLVSHCKHSPNQAWVSSRRNLFLPVRAF